MKVADLKQHLTDLARLLEASKAAVAAKDLNMLAGALAPFDEQTPAEFTSFLAAAHEYHTTGKLSASLKPIRAASPRPTKSKADPAEIAAAIRQLYDHSGDLSTTAEQIEAELARMNGLNKDGLLKVCEAMDLAVIKKWTKDQIAQVIRQQIFDRRGAAQRRERTELPPEVDEPSVAP